MSGEISTQIINKLQFRHYRGAQSGERRFLGVEGVQLVD